MNLSLFRIVAAALLVSAATFAWAEDKKETEPVLPGVLITRSNGQFLNLNIESNRFVIRFLDEKKKPIAADAKSGRIAYSSSTTRERRDHLARDDDGKILRGQQNVARPYVFNVRLTLVKDSPSPETEEAAPAQTTESYTLAVNLPTTPPETVSIYEMSTEDMKKVAP